MHFQLQLILHVDYCIYSFVLIVLIRFKSYVKQGCWYWREVGHPFITDSCIGKSPPTMHTLFLSLTDNILQVGGTSTIRAASNRPILHLALMSCTVSNKAEILINTG